MIRDATPDDPALQGVARLFGTTRFILSQGIRDAGDHVLYAGDSTTVVAAALVSRWGRVETLLVDSGPTITEWLQVHVREALVARCAEIRRAPPLRLQCRQAWRGDARLDEVQRLLNWWTRDALVQAADAGEVGYILDTQRYVVVAAAVLWPNKQLKAWDAIANPLVRQALAQYLRELGCKDEQWGPMKDFPPEWPAGVFRIEVTGV